MPRVELGLEPLRRSAAKEVAIPALEPVELGAVRGMERGEIAVEILGVEHAGLELRERLLERVGEAAEAGRRGEAIELRVRKDPADEQRALRLRHERPCALPRVRDALEDVVEGPDVAGEERLPSREQLALHALDVRPVRHD